ncbi:MFS transporter [Amycolatopsis sp. SID8362]|uniref:MFS transporter n=1 Tax=Amycolatopsis sp. SID8362 TaxID=2690346 RepID=UPI001368C06C|nr:MFS transporter [Amycolatopsis sp. SID8362]NBH04721.1 MFS transporter [Amycolatopsis sp. SID8362]NED41421.1 MFS transporter [Amycolatopsis sp. SID8362]
MVRDRRLFLTATLIDALGSGLWVPFALLFLVHGQGLGLVDAGTSLSTGALLALVTGPGAGVAMDRFGPRALLVAGNLVRVGAFCAYPFVHSGWQVIVVSTVAGVGDRLFWTCNAPMAAQLAGGRDTDRVLATQTAGRFAGAGVGAAAMAVLPTFTSPWAFHLLAYVNAASFAVAAVLIRLLPRAEARADAPAGSWRAVLGDRPFTGFCITHLAFTFASASKFAVLPIVVRDLLHGPQWIAGTAITLGTVVVVTTQRPVVAVLARRSRTAGLIGAAVLFAACFALLIPLEAVPLGVATGLILVASAGFSVAEAMFGPTATAAAAEAAPPGAEGRASSIFQLSWGLPVALAPGLLALLLTAGNALTWSVLALTCAAAVPALLALRKRLPAALREPSPPVPA